MFTGIVEELGVVRQAGPRLSIAAHTVLADLSEGASVAVNGVCLTTVDIQPDGFSADLAPETLRRSNLGDLVAGARVNLERPLSLAARISGHLVQGHVDGTGTLLALDSVGNGNWWLRVRIPAELDRYFVYKGSVSIDGISLTIASIQGLVLEATIIPHTYQNTTLASHRPGDRLNLECDMLAKHVEKLLGAMQYGSPSISSS